jgi:hypothetical protein
MNIHNFLRKGQAEVPVDADCEENTSVKINKMIRREFIDRCELWGFIHEINSGISHCEISVFFCRNYFYKTISVMVTSFVVLR